MRHAVLDTEGMKPEKVEMKRGRKIMVCRSREVTHMHLPVAAEQDKSVRTLGRCTGPLHHSGTVLQSGQLSQILKASHCISSNLIRGISGHDVRNYTQSSFQGHYYQTSPSQNFSGRTRNNLAAFRSDRMPNPSQTSSPGSACSYMRRTQGRVLEWPPGSS